MIITLESLANKTAKSAEGLVISDHSLDLDKFTGAELILTGVGTKRLLLKNIRSKTVIFRDLEIRYSGTNILIKFEGTVSNAKILGDNARLYCTTTEQASQVIYFQATWSNVELAGFKIDQGRHWENGPARGGACVQFAGVYASKISTLGRLHVHDMEMLNTGGEGLYVNHFKKADDAGVPFAAGEELLVEYVTVNNSGRDFIQQQGFKKVAISHCIGNGGGKEADNNHCSALSMNGGCLFLNVFSCTFTDVPQLAYVGTEGVTIEAIFQNVHYDQESARPVNQVAYFKGPGYYKLTNNTITAPNALICAITADGAKVELIAPNTITAPKLERHYNGGSVIETIPPPTVIEYVGPLNVTETTTYDGVKTFKYVYNGVELIQKP